VAVREARHGIHLVGLSRNIIVSDCHLYHNRGVGLYIDHVDLHQINVVGSHISFNAGGGIVSRGGYLRNLQVGTCDIEGNMAHGAPATANVLLDSTGGSTGEVAITGCTIQHSSAVPGSANVRILGAGTEAKRPTQEGHVAIVGNVLSDTRVNIHIRDARGVTILGNTFWKGHEHDIVVEGARNVIVGPNNLDRNPRYRPSPGAEGPPHQGLVFRDSSDVSLNGLVVSGVREEPAALVIERCDRVNVTDCTIVDYDRLGLLLRDVTRSRVSGCLIRDDRGGSERAPTLRAVGGRGNMIVHNLFAQGVEIAPGTALVEGNLDPDREPHP
jgi:hypothetical protein